MNRKQWIIAGIVVVALLAAGFMFFVFTIGALRWDRKAIALSLVVFILYGGAIMGIFPERQDISYESHFFGAFFGLVLAVLLRNTDPRPPEKQYDWEDENEQIPEDQDHVQTPD